MGEEHTKVGFESMDGTSNLERSGGAAGLTFCRLVGSDVFSKLFQRCNIPFLSPFEAATQNIVLRFNASSLSRSQDQELGRD